VREENSPSLARAGRSVPLVRYERFKFNDALVVSHDRKIPVEDESRTIREAIARS
jgi:hypothetical protein